MDIQSREGDGTKRRVVLQDYTGTERILVVDDIPEQLDIAVRMLSRLGYQVASAPGSWNIRLDGVYHDQFIFESQ